MQFHSNIQVTSPPDAVVWALRQPALWQALLPDGGKASAAGPGQIDLGLSRGVGLFATSMTGRLHIAPRGRGFGQRLSFAASHLLAGSLEVEVQVEITPLPLASLLNLTGTITASGAAGRYLTGRQHEVNAAVDRMVRQLRRLLELPTLPSH